MNVDWPTIFPRVTPDKMGYGIRQFEEVVRDYFEDGWSKQGSLYCRGRKRGRIGFAIRNTTVSWHFRDRDLLILYWEICNFGTVTAATIQFDHGDEYSEEALRFIISKAND